MPPRGRAGAGSGAQDGLSAEQLTQLSQDIAAGKRPTVYLREDAPSLQLPAGSSAKVVSVVGDSVTIRPKGINDELAFEAEELRSTRLPAGGSRAAPTARARATKSAPRVSAAKVATASVSAPTRSVGAAKGLAAPGPVASAAVMPPSSAQSGPPQSGEAPGRPASPAPRGRPKRSKVGVSVTINVGVEELWTVAVTHGAGRPGKALPVTAEAVAAAVRALGEPTAEEAVTAVLAAAREAAATRVAELSRQLEEARNTLQALGENG